jgi:hypothetical protein
VTGVVATGATGVVAAEVQTPAQVELLRTLSVFIEIVFRSKISHLHSELVLVHTGHETVHGQSVMVKVVAEVTV